MKNIPLIALFSLWSQATGLAFQEEAPKLTSFANGLELIVPSAGVQTLLLPEEVYRGVTDLNLADLRVFNAAGEAVPYALRTWVDEQSVEYGTVTRPLFAIRDQAGAGLDDLTLQLTRSDDGRVLKVTTTEAPSESDGNAPGRIAAYIVDLSDIERPVNALNFVLTSQSEDFFCPYSIETSPDLSAWTTVVSRETLASTFSGGSRLLRTRVELPQTTGTYLRLKWLAGSPPMELENVQLELAAGIGTPQSRSVRLKGEQREGQANTFDFPSPGPLPITRVQVHLPEANTLIMASVVTRYSEESSNRTVLSGKRFFRTGSEGEFQNSPYVIRAHTAVHWSLFVDPNGSGLGQGTPELELEYSPHQLAFLAKAGEGPFVLAFGRYGARPASMTWDAMTAAQPGELATETVTVGAVRELGGPVHLLAPENAGRTKLYILWAVLLGGVGLLGGLCLRLAKKMA